MSPHIRVYPIAYLYLNDVFQNQNVQQGDTTRMECRVTQSSMQESLKARHGLTHERARTHLIDSIAIYAFSFKVILISIILY